jgi:hypothetical protein
MSKKKYCHVKQNQPHNPSQLQNKVTKKVEYSTGDIARSVASSQMPISDRMLNGFFIGTSQAGKDQTPPWSKDWPYCPNINKDNGVLRHQ